MRELMKVIQQESYTYADPITQFLECLYIDYDFEGAQQKLKECEEVGRAIRFGTPLRFAIFGLLRVALLFTDWRLLFSLYTSLAFTHRLRL